MLNFTGASCAIQRRHGQALTYGRKFFSPTGGLVGLLGDRFSADAAGRAGPLRLPFLGHDADFPTGPLRLAMLMKQRVVFMVGLYRGGNRYDVRFEPLADFRDPPADAAARDAALRAALVAYVRRLEALCREAPMNWFNFHDFWRDDDESR